MKTLLTVFASLWIASTASATNVPKFETYFGFDWVRFNPDTARTSSFDAKGGSVQLVYNFTKGIGLAFDAGSVTKDTFGGVVTNRQTHYLLGPRFGYYNHSRFRPFGEVLFGGATGSASFSVSDINRVTVNPLFTSTVILPDNFDVRFRASRTSFAMMAGGGLDIRVTKHFTYRLFNADYFLARPTSFITGEDVNKNNVRLTTGFNFTWGTAE